VPWVQAVASQLIPRWWDVWHLYLTPPAEKPLYRVVKKLAALEVREYYPRVAVEAEVFDVRARPRTEWAWVLPEAAFTDELRLQGRAEFRETYVTTSPIEVCVESVDWVPPVEAGLNLTGGAALPAKRIRWSVPLPSHLGFNVSGLPPCETKEKNATLGEACRYVPT
jgi:hypothetical protein